jgi:hypothetical protein
MEGDGGPAVQRREAHEENAIAAAQEDENCTSCSVISCVIIRR